MSWPTTIVVVASVVLMAATPGWAQQKFKVPPSDPGASTKYTEQHVVDVGDVPGHQIRVATLHTKNSDKAGEFDGVKTVESTAWLASDYINGSGRFMTYGVALMASGDKIFSRTEGLSHTTVAADGTRKTSYSTVTTYTGGTGRFATMRGGTRATGTTDFKTGTTTTSVEGEYWFDK
jgi:hypothetical protein